MQGCITVCFHVFYLKWGQGLQELGFRLVVYHPEIVELEMAFSFIEYFSAATL